MRIPKYNPAFLEAPERARRFGGRERDLAELVRVLRENLARPRNQHVIVVAPRGMGKTTLLLRTIDEVRATPDVAAGWFPIVAPEESYRAGTLGELWLEMIFQLSRETGDPAHEEAYERLRADHDRPGARGDDRLAIAALGYLLDFSDTIGKRLVLVVENLQMLFGEQLAERDVWALRKVLIGEPRIMLLGSAVASFREIDDPKAALYEQFLVHRLDPLDTDGCLDLWFRATGTEAPRKRMRALEILTGGNPRLLTILAEFAGNLSLKELTRDLANLIDEHTDYLKMTTEALPALERKVFVTLAEIWDYASASEIARQARIQANVASAQLARLADRGAVAWRRRGRGKQYRVAERLYSIYHLMRRRGAAAARARATTEFMVAFYDTHTLIRRLDEIAREAAALPPADRTEHLSILGTLLEIPSLRDRAAELPHTASLPPAVLGALHIANYRALKDPPQRALEALEEVSRLALAEPGITAEFLLSLQAWIDSHRSHSLLELGKLHDSLAAITRALEIYEKLASDDPLFLSNFAWSLDRFATCQHQLQQNHQALSAINRALEIYEKLAVDNPRFLSAFAMSLNRLAAFQESLGQYSEAAESISKAVDIADKLLAGDRGTWLPVLLASLSNLAYCQWRLGLREKALVSLSDGIELLRGVHVSSPIFARPLAAALNLKASFLEDEGDTTAAQTFFAEALALDPNAHSVRLSLSLLLLREGQSVQALDHLGHFLDSGEGDERRTSSIIDLSIALAAGGHAAHALSCIESSPRASLLEPLRVALAKYLEYDVSAPAEIDSIAGDIVREIREQHAQLLTPAAKE